MIPPSVHPKLLPRKYRVDPFRTALADAAAELRTLEELEMERAELDQKRCDTSKYTVPQRRAFNQEKRHLDYIIRDKKIANGCLMPVMGSRNGKMVTKPSKEMSSSGFQIRLTCASMEAVRIV